MFFSFNPVSTCATPASTRHGRLVVAATLSLACGLAQAAPFTNGNFSSTAGWVFQGSALYGDTNDAPAAAMLPANQPVAVLRASPGGPAASITQTFDHTAVQYNISFDMAAPVTDAAMALLVTFNGFSQIPNGQSSLQPIYPVAGSSFTFLPSGWVHVSFSNVASVQPFTGSPLGVLQDQLAISTLSPALANSELLIRNVVVDPIGAAIPAVPEPQTYALMLLGLGAVGAAARRKAQNAGR